MSRAVVRGWPRWSAGYRLPRLRRPGMPAGGPIEASRIAATAPVEVRQICAIARLVASGERLISNSISAARRIRLRSSRELSAGAESIAASPARARLHGRQKVLSPDRVQVAGRATRLPSILPAETAQRAHLHLTALAAIVLRPWPCFVAGDCAGDGDARPRWRAGSVRRGRCPGRGSR